MSLGYTPQGCIVRLLLCKSTWDSSFPVWFLPSTQYGVRLICFILLPIFRDLFFNLNLFHNYVKFTKQVIFTKHSIYLQNIVRNVAPISTLSTRSLSSSYRGLTVLKVWGLALFLKTISRYLQFHSLPLQLSYISSSIPHTIFFMLVFNWQKYLVEITSRAVHNIIIFFKLPSHKWVIFYSTAH